jgi:hypothetical protein
MSLSFEQGRDAWFAWLRQNAVIFPDLTGADLSRLKALLVTQGVRLRIDRHFVEALDHARLWDDTPIPAGLRNRVCVTGRSCRRSTRSSAS